MGDDYIVEEGIEQQEEPTIADEHEEFEDAEMPEIEAYEDDEVLDEEPAPRRKDEYVPLATLLETKKQLKQTQSQLKAFEEQQRQQQMQQRQYSVYQDYVGRGYPEVEAQRLAAKDMQYEMDKEMVTHRLVDSDIRELSRSDAFYADAEQFKDEIKAKMRQVPGLTPEDAYMMIRGKTRTKEMQTKQQQLDLAKRQGQAKVPQTSAATSVKSSVRLDKDDEAAYRILKQHDPSWTKEKYIKLMKKE